MRYFCTKTGLEVVTEPSWLNRQMSEALEISFWVIGGSCVYCRPKGRADLPGAEAALKMLETVAGQVLGEAGTYVLINDWLLFRGASAEARKYLRHSTIDLQSLHSVIFCNVPVPSAIGIHFARRFFANVKQFTVVKHYGDAIREAMARLPLGMESVDALDKEIGLAFEAEQDTLRCIDIQTVVDNGHAGIAARIINRRIAHMPYGTFSSPWEQMPDGYPADATIDCLVVDLAGASLLELSCPALLGKAAGWKAVLPLEAVVLYDTRSAVQAIVADLAAESSLQISFAVEVSTAMSPIHKGQPAGHPWLENGHYRQRRDPVNCKDIERLMTMMSDIDWTKRSVSVDSRLEIDENAPLSPLLQSILLIKEEVDDLLDERDRNVEALCRSREEIADNRMKLSLALDVSKVGQWELHVKGEGGDFTFNDQFYALYGTNARIDGGSPMSAQDYAAKFLLPEDAWIVREEIRKLHSFDKSEEFREVEHRIVRLDGEVRHVAVRYKLLRDQDGNPVKTIGANQDITDRKRIEEKLQKAKQQAESASQAKSVFLANMSHEIRTPINGLLGTLQLLQKTGLDGIQKAYIDTAIQSTRRLNRLLSDILDLSRVEAGKMQLHSEPFEFQDVLGSVIQLFEPTARAGNIALQWQVDPAIPQTLSGDSVRFQQVVGNLVGNAIKFTERGTVSVEAHLLPLFKEDVCRILCVVSDTGIGISDRVLVTLFDPFTQEDRWKKRKSEGAGLGLAISRQLVALMGGSMAVVSKEGEGTTFYLSVPFKREAPRLEAVPPGRQLQMPHGLKVLLAEDDLVSRMVATKFLESFGYHVDAVEHGALVLEKLQEEGYDLLLLDVQMPVLSGVEVTRAIRQGRLGERCRNIPIIAMTACAMSGDKQLFIDAGMNGYVEKPIEIATLQRELSRTFRHDDQISP